MFGAPTYSPELTHHSLGESSALGLRRFAHETRGSNLSSFPRVGSRQICGRQRSTQGPQPMEVVMPSHAALFEPASEEVRQQRNRRKGPAPGAALPAQAALASAAGAAQVPLVVHAAQPFVGMSMQAQPAYWPADPYGSSPSIHDRILHQVHYYFSAENLCRDEFLRGHMDQEEGWLPIQLIASFNRLRSLTSDVELITAALQLSPELEVRDFHVRKRHDWQRWLLPASPQTVSKPASPSQAPSDQAFPADAAKNSGHVLASQKVTPDTPGRPCAGPAQSDQPPASSGLHYAAPGASGHSQDHSAPSVGSNEQTSLWRDVASKRPATHSVSVPSGSQPTASSSSRRTKLDRLSSAAAQPPVASSHEAASTQCSGVPKSASSAKAPMCTSKAVNGKAVALGSAATSDPPGMRAAGKKAVPIATRDAQEAKVRADAPQDLSASSAHEQDIWIDTPELWEAHFGSSSSWSPAAEEGEWETPHSRRAIGRRGYERKHSGDKEIGLTHLKDTRSLVPDPKGEYHTSQRTWDEEQSDQTTLLNEEDWSSAGSSEEPRSSSPDDSAELAAPIK